MSVTPVVELEGVSFAYRPGQPVLTDVDLAVAESEFVAVAGPNGGGKTTLIRLVLGLARPAGGSVRLFGEPAHRFSRRATLGYVAQRARLGGQGPITVREVVSAGRLARGGLLGPLRARDRAIVEEAIADVGLGELGDARLSELSARLWQGPCRRLARDVLECCDSSPARPGSSWAVRAGGLG